jgi:hypothetical protein
MADLESSPELGLRPLRGSRSSGKGQGRWRRWRQAHLWAHRSSGGGETVAQLRGMAGGGQCLVGWGMRTREQGKEGGRECAGEGHVGRGRDKWPTVNGLNAIEGGAIY